MLLLWINLHWVSFEYRTCHSIHLFAKDHTQIYWLNMLVVRAIRSTSEHMLAIPKKALTIKLTTFKYEQTQHWHETKFCWLNCVMAKLIHLSKNLRKKNVIQDNLPIKYKKKWQQLCLYSDSFFRNTLALQLVDSTFPWKLKIYLVTLLITCLLRIG